LKEERRLADPRLAADEDERARYQPTAEDAVELADPDGQAGKIDLADGGERDRRFASAADRA
jgi:hypothetical protein